MTRKLLLLGALLVSVGVTAAQGGDYWNGDTGSGTAVLYIGSTTYGDVSTEPYSPSDSTLTQAMLSCDAGNDYATSHPTDQVVQGGTQVQVQVQGCYGEVTLNGWHTVSHLGGYEYGGTFVSDWAY